MLIFSKIGDIKKVDLGQLLSFVLVKEIRNKFQNLWAVDSDGIIIVEKVSKEKRKKLEEDGTEEEMDKKLIDKMKGFSKLLQFISDSGKPLIGHNCFLDLIKLFHQFFNHLPVKYKDFKKQIHHLFPIIFDTKNICLNVQKKISKVHPELEHVFTSSNLNELHETLGTLFIIHFIKNKIRSTHIMYLSTFFFIVFKFNIWKLV